MTHVAKRLLVLCLLALPTAALADVYQLTPPPDMRIDTFTAQSGLTMIGVVETIGDALGTGCYSSECPYAETLTFSSTSSGFTITGNTAADLSGTYTYLSGSYVQSAFDASGGTDGELGIEYSVTYDNQALWTALEKEGAPYVGGTDTQNATNLPDGTLMVMDIHNYGTDDALADMTPAPAQTPEPATLTLLCSGLAAGLLRKRLARNKK
jgi:hypothetical protein